MAPLEPQFHAEFESEGPRASFFDFDAVSMYFYIKKRPALKSGYPPPRLAPGWFYVFLIGEWDIVIVKKKTKLKLVYLCGPQHDESS